MRFHSSALILDSPMRNKKMHAILPSPRAVPAQNEVRCSYFHFPLSAVSTDIRHSHASLLINQGCDALILADRLGHEKVSTTLNTYSHLFPHKQQELVNNLEQLAAAASVTSTPEPPDGNPLLEAAGIPYNHTEVSDTDTSTTNAIAVNLPYGPAPLTKNKTSAKIIQMPQRKII